MEAKRKTAYVHKVFGRQIFGFKPFCFKFGFSLVDEDISLSKRNAKFDMEPIVRSLKFITRSPTSVFINSTFSER